MLPRVTTFISTTYLANPDTIKLGRIVLDPRNPHENYCDLFPNQDELFQSCQFEISISSSIDLTGTYNSTGTKSLNEALSKLFARRFQSTIGDGVTLEGGVQRYQLENPHIVFSKTCEGKQKVQDWLRENVIKAALDAYMVVGYHTIESPKVVKDKMHGRPIFAAAVTGLGGISGVGNLASLEGVWGVQYRKVVCKLTHWSSEVQLKLKDNQWKMPWSVRGQDNSIQNVAEADLGDAAEPDPADSDDEDEEPPESYFINDVSGEVVEEYILFHDHEDEGSPAEVPVFPGGE